jgi:hypothetical protein
VAEEKKPEAAPKIVVDEDWKNQAQAEKEQLAQAPADAKAEAAQGLPPATLSTLVQGIATEVLFYLGLIQDPRTGKRYRDMNLAKHNIDLLVMLEEKTKGNLTEDEKKLLDTVLYQARISYVQVAQAGMP